MFWTHLELTCCVVTCSRRLHPNGGIKGRSLAWTSPVETLVCCCRLQFVKKKKKKKKKKKEIKKKKKKKKKK